MLHLITTRPFLSMVIAMLLSLGLDGCSKSAGQSSSVPGGPYHPYVPFAGADYTDGAQKLYDATVSGQGGIKEVQVEKADVVSANMSSGVMYFSFEGSATITLTDGEKLKCNFWEQLEGNLPNGTRTMEHFGYDTPGTDSPYRDYKAWNQHLGEDRFSRSNALRYALSIDQMMQDMGARLDPKSIQDWAKANSLSWPDRGAIYPDGAPIKSP